MPLVKTLCLCQSPVKLWLVNPCNSCCMQHLSCFEDLQSSHGCLGGLSHWSLSYWSMVTQSVSKITHHAMFPLLKNFVHSHSPSLHFNFSSSCHLLKKSTCPVLGDFFVPLVLLNVQKETTNKSSFCFCGVHQLHISCTVDDRRRFAPIL